LDWSELQSSLQVMNMMQLCMWQRYYDHIQKIQPCVCTSRCFQKLHSLLIFSYRPIINTFLLKNTILNIEGSSSVDSSQWWRWWQRRPATF